MLSIFSVAGITGENNAQPKERVGAPFQIYIRRLPKGGDAVPVVACVVEWVEQNIHYYHE